MILAPDYNHKQLSSELSALDLSNSLELKTYAGFSADSDLAGQPRRTASLILTDEDLLKIQRVSEELYSKLRADVASSEVIPFDMIRYDAYYDPDLKVVKILEINTRNVGLHEITEWIDDKISSLNSKLEPTDSLNHLFVSNQSILMKLSENNRDEVLYISKPNIPRWLYYEELSKRFFVSSCVNIHDLTFTNEGVVFNHKSFTKVVRKMPPKLPEKFRALVGDGVVASVQPIWMRQFGMKDYLESIEQEEVLSSEVFKPNKIEQYRKNKDSLVCKITDLGSASGVFIGAQLSGSAWESVLDEATKNPERWILQEYADAQVGSFAIHGKDEIRKMRFQLGVFVLPQPGDASKINMDIVVKAYSGNDQYILFDPSGENNDIWFGNVIVVPK